MLMRSLLSFAMLALSVSSSLALEDTREQGHALTQAFQEGDDAAIWERMTDEMRQALEDESALGALREQIEAQFGAEGSILSETAVPSTTFRVYTRTSEYENGELTTQWTFDRDGAVAGFFIRPPTPAATSEQLDYETHAALRLPFEGEWFVFWGGRTTDRNYHAADAGQRFATDFTLLREGTNHSGAGDRAEDYHCWDEPILAPADGVVAAVVSDLPDQEIGSSDPANPAGNHVVLELGGGEFAFLAHMRQGSIEVAEGDEVEAGEVLGRCGNSGNTSEPHLHFHLQTSPVLGEGEGLPAFFNDYMASGEPVTRGEPQQGEMLEPLNQPAP